MRGHHVCKDIWTPFVGETLSCKREEDTTADPYAVAVKKRFGRRMPVVVGHMPRRISAASCLFLQRHGIIKCEITGVRRYSPEYLEVPCKYICSGEPKYISKLKLLLRPYNATFKKTSNQVDAELSPCKTRKVENQVEAEPSCKVVMSSCKTKVECNNIIDLEKVSTT